MSLHAELLPGFEEGVHRTSGVELHYWVAGAGPPVVLLHGYPQSSLAWHRVAPELARRNRVVLVDLRGCGSSSCPPSDAEHRAYSKRTMAGDVASLMVRLGLGQFTLIGHDRGGRVAYRLALDRPDVVRRLIVIDILTTWDQWQPERQSMRHGFLHWAMLAQPAPIPETLIGADPGEWIEARFRRATMNGSLEAFDPRAYQAYLRAATDPERIHAACEDHRAGASCDLEDDRADRVLGRRIACPMLIVAGSHGSLRSVPDPVSPWRVWCDRVSAKVIESGHFVPEENPMGLIAALEPFLFAPQE